MPTVLRFVDAGGVPTVDLNGPVFVLGRLHLGQPELRRQWLHQDGVDGALPHSDSLGIAIMTLDITLKKQTSAATMKSAIDALNIELNRTTNIIEYRPNGWPNAYFIDIYRSQLVSMHRGEDKLDPFQMLRDGSPVTLFIERAPYAGDTVAGSRLLTPV